MPHHHAPSPYLVPFDGSFRVASFPTDAPKEARDEKALEARLAHLTGELDELQRKLYATDRYALLAVFQALDAAGKDGTIRAVLHGVDPQGIQVQAFKQPSAEEIDHDFLWRAVKALPERGRIGIFNRSYYEEVLVVRVHPEYLRGEKLPEPLDETTIWEERFESIRALEQHLARSGTVVVKFWLNVSREEQRKRFVKRIDEAEKNWKFNEGDVAEHAHFDKYMAAFEAALNATSRPWAPWYAIPADDKDYMRVAIAEVLVETLKRLPLAYPVVTDERRQKLRAMRDTLKSHK